MTLSHMDDYPQFRRNRNVLPLPVQPDAADREPEGFDSLDEWDVEAARRLLEPRSRLGPLFGLTQKDLNRASERIEILTQRDLGLGVDLFQMGVSQRLAARFGKRTLDVVLSGLALIVLAPLFLLISIFVRLDSPGPTFFRQNRVGLYGREFPILKFRSMVATAEQDLYAILARINEEQDSGLLFKMRHDPRITRVGRVLRKYSLDELPQLWNIFVGDMSIVGPRPPLPFEAGQYVDHQQRRLYVKPGLTGLWQVNGRSALTWEQSMRLDLYYVENWSVLGDLIIMWRTLRVLTRPVADY
ncbi:sugar transferase [Glaciihabitans sp. UYNi722]|uniref:sugar transferase n=1 Tax=Glaciihabitans sp. UYNi722 TaxID=3156344 RepID=UPI0033919699